MAKLVAGTYLMELARISLTEKNGKECAEYVFICDDTKDDEEYLGQKQYHNQFLNSDMGLSIFKKHLELFKINANNFFEQGTLAFERGQGPKVKCALENSSPDVNGKTYVNVKWINGLDYVPKSLDKGKMTSLKDRFSLIKTETGGDGFTAPPANSSKSKKTETVDDDVPF